MSSNEKKRFTVITNTEYEKDIEKQKKTYHTNPLTEKLMRFVNEEVGPKFTIKDLFKS